MCIYIAIYYHGNHKPKISNRYTHKKRERNLNIILKIVIKSQGKRAKQEERNKKRTTRPPQSN